MRWRILVSLLSLAIICFGVRYAVARERLRQTDPHAIYQQVNSESFNNELPDVPVRWSDAGDDNYGLTHFYDDGTALIDIDPRNVTTEAMLLETVRHESCHIYSQAVVEETRQDVHGEAFQTCMKRFEEK